MHTRDDADTVQLSKIRIKEALRSDLEEAAAKNRVTMNAEIARRLDQSFRGIEGAFGGKAGLELAVMLTANFKFAGDRMAAADGHPEPEAGEWLLDAAIFERALAALVDAVWAHRSPPGTHQDFYNWLQTVYHRRLSREMTEEYRASNDAAEKK